MENKNKPDYLLLATVGMIMLLGFLVFTSVSMTQIAIYAEDIEDLNLLSYLIRQFLVGILPGTILGLILYKMPIEKIKALAPYLLIFNLILIGLLFLPGTGTTVRGARRWLQLGPLSFQPSEFLKLSFIIYISSWLSSKKTTKKIFSETFVVFSVVCAVIGGLMMIQKDLSTLIVILASAFMIYFTYKTPISHIISLMILGLFSISAFIVLFPYRLERVKSFISLTSESTQEMPYQIRQSLIAIGSGGIFGLGFGMGNQKYGFLPFPLSDSIFASFAEEAGFIGSVILVCLYSFFIYRTVLIAKKNKDPFLSLVSVGIGSWIFFQAFIHIGAMSGVIPVTGIPLPFISYGGTHMMSELAALGLLLNVSRY